MVNLSTFSRHFEEFRKYISYLKELKKYKKEEILHEWYVYGLIERYFQLAIECALSLGEQIISNYGFRAPNHYRDIVYILGEKKVIPKRLSEEMSELAGFRNILVHGYTKIDRNLVYQHLQKDISNLEQYAKHLAKFTKI